MEEERSFWFSEMLARARERARDALEFRYVFQDVKEIEDHVKNAERPLVWTPIGRHWRRMEIVGTLRSSTAMYGLVDAEKPIDPDGEPRRVYLLYPELLSVERPSFMPGLVPCYLWHHRRRLKMLTKHPEIRHLMKRKEKPSYEAWLGGLLLLHLILACACGWACASASAGGWLAGAAVAVGASATLGAFCAFNLQQLTHEISHNVLNTSYGLHALMFLSDLSFGVCGPGWHSYYLLLHNQHHQSAGSREDPDVSFQMYWSVIPRTLSTTRMGRVAWVTIFGLFTQIVVLTCHFIGVNRLNFLMQFKLPLAFLLASKLAFWCGSYYLFGMGSVLYLWLSSGFALGAFAHPYLGFWIIQHLAVPKNGHQPTVSYGGSEWWQYANFGALRHVEHHDFPTIPFTLVHKVRDIAPEYYRDLYKVPSIVGIIWEWICHTDGTAWMDFAANQRYVMSTSELPTLTVGRPRLLHSILSPISARAEQLLQPKNDAEKRQAHMGHGGGGGGGGSSVEEDRGGERSRGSVVAAKTDFEESSQDDWEQGDEDLLEAQLGVELHHDDETDRHTDADEKRSAATRAPPGSPLSSQ